MKRRTVAFILTGFVVVSCCVSAVMCRADEADNWFEQGRANYDHNFYGKALECFDSTLALNPNHIGSLFLRGITYYGLTDFDKAVADFSRIIEINNRFVKAYY
jgi:tetratricopeptide (TPR) repeat protein